MDPQTAQPAQPLYRHPLFYLAALAIVVLGLFAALMLPSVSNTTNLQGAAYETGLEIPLVRIAQLGKFYRYPDPQSITGDPSNVANQAIYEGLVESYDGKAKPLLATSWTNPDKLTWRFTLRPGVKFHSGDALTAEDVKYSIDIAKADENWGSNGSTSAIKEVVVVDAKTIDVKTTEPTPSLLTSLSNLFILSKAQVEKDGVTKAVGTGPFRIVSFDKETAIFEANTTYWGGKPKADVVMYRYYPKRDDAVAALQTDQVDLVPVSSATVVDDLKSKGFQSTTRPGDIAVIGFNLSDDIKKVEGTNGKNPFKDVKVRKAIWAALDGEKIAKAAPGNEGGSLSQLSTKFSLGYNSSIPEHKQDLTVAKKLLADANYSNGFTFTLLMPTSGEPFAKEIQKELAAVGLTMNIDLQDFNTYLEKLGFGDAGEAGEDFAAYFLNEPNSVDSLLTLNDLTNSEGAYYSISNYSDKDTDTLLNQALAEFDLAKRTELTKQAQAKFVADLPYVPTYFKSLFFVARNNIALDSSLNDGPIYAKYISGRKSAD